MLWIAKVSRCWTYVMAFITATFNKDASRCTRRALSWLTVSYKRSTGFQYCKYKLKYSFALSHHQLSCNWIKYKGWETFHMKYFSLLSFVWYHFFCLLSDSFENYLILMISLHLIHVLFYKKKLHYKVFFILLYVDNKALKGINTYVPNITRFYETLSK